MSYLKIAKQKFNKLTKDYNKEDVIILAIETSCDETSIAVVKNGTKILSNIISSQIDIHKKFGGVVPEVASRNHLLALNNVLDEALRVAKTDVNKVSAIAVTFGAGLMGALLVGVSFAKALAFNLNIPLIKVNHIKGHVSANYYQDKNLKPPFISLIVSGGHTAIVRTDSETKNTLIASTQDDAVGEAYDKVAKILNIGYPGGPVIDSLAKSGKDNIKFISSHPKPHDFAISYSGLKTAVLNYANKEKQKGNKLNINDICASFQAQAINQLVSKTLLACKKFNLKTVAVAGGVAANSYLREKLTLAGKQENIKVVFPPIVMCTDNAAMIAIEAYNLIKNKQGFSDLRLTANPNLNLKYEKIRI